MYVLLGGMKIGRLPKPRRRQQRERHKTKGLYNLISRTVAMQVYVINLGTFRSCHLQTTA